MYDVISLDCNSCTVSEDYPAYNEMFVPLPPVSKRQAHPNPVIPIGHNTQKRSPKVEAWRQINKCIREGERTL